MDSNGTFTAEDDVSAIIGMFGAKLGVTDAPLTLIVRMTMRADAGAVVDAAFARAHHATMKDAGAISFDLNHDAADPNVVVVYERWRSLADLETHLRTSHATILRDAFNDLIVGVPEFTILTPVPFMIADGETRGALA